MTQHNFAAILADVVARLKYEELSGLVGRSLHLSSPETAPDEVLTQCQDELPLFAQFDHPPLEQRQITISRRGLLDLRYRIDPSVLDTIAPAGQSFLQTLGWWADDDEDNDDRDDGDLEFSGLSILHEDLAQGHAYVLLFLQTWEELTPEAREYRRLYGLPPNFFVTSYRITDACLTNAKSIWLYKRFY